MGGIGWTFTSFVRVCSRPIATSTKEWPWCLHARTVTSRQSAEQLTHRVRYPFLWTTSRTHSSLDPPFSPALFTLHGLIILSRLPFTGVAIWPLSVQKCPTPCPEIACCGIHSPWDGESGGQRQQLSQHARSLNLHIVQEGVGGGGKVQNCLSDTCSARKGCTGESLIWFSLLRVRLDTWQPVLS